MKQRNVPPQPDESFFPVFRSYEVHVPDDKTGKAPDRRQIDVSEPYELGYWSRRFGVSTQRLSEAIQKAGPMADDVERELKQQIAN